MPEKIGEGIAIAILGALSVIAIGMKLAEALKGRRVVMDTSTNGEVVSGTARTWT